MKVLHITNLYPTVKHSTYGIFVKEQIKSLEDKNLQNYYFINAKEFGIKAYFKAFVDLYYLTKKYDILHCHHQFSVLPVIFSKKKKILSVLGDLSKRSLSNRIIYYLVKQRCKIIIFKNTIPIINSKYYLLPNGVNTEVFIPIEITKARKILNLDQSKIYVLFVCNGNLDNPIKRKDKFDRVLEELNKNGIIYEELILSNVERDKIVYYYNSANLMLVTSEHEGSPNAVKEAMACNLPIVSTPVGDVYRNLKNVTNSFVTKSFEIGELVESIKRVDPFKKSNSRNKIFSMKLDLSTKTKELTKLYSNLFSKS
jgi:teichuronic acid biosynthesis glycosyltransferase TuaC